MNLIRDITAINSAIDELTKKYGLTAFEVSYTKTKGGRRLLAVKVAHPDSTGNQWKANCQLEDLGVGLGAIEVELEEAIKGAIGAYDEAMASERELARRAREMEQQNLEKRRAIRALVPDLITELGQLAESPAEASDSTEGRTNQEENDRGPHEL